MVTAYHIYHMLPDFVCTIFNYAIATSSMILTESTPTEISTPSSTPSTGMMMSSTWTELTSSTT